MATYQQWSQSYFTDLTSDQHDANNQWFQCMRDKLTSNGILYVYKYKTAIHYRQNNNSIPSQDDSADYLVLFS